LFTAFVIDDDTVQCRSVENTAGHGGGVAERSAATRPLPATANEAVDGSISDAATRMLLADDVSKGREGGDSSCGSDGGCGS
jgi:hypothetical protein